MHSSTAESAWPPQFQEFCSSLTRSSPWRPSGRRNTGSTTTWNEQYGRLHSKQTIGFAPAAHIADLSYRDEPFLYLAYVLDVRHCPQVRSRTSQFSPNALAQRN